MKTVMTLSTKDRTSSLEFQVRIQDPYSSCTVWLVTDPDPDDGGFVGFWDDFTQYWPEFEDLPEPRWEDYYHHIAYIGD